ncbi:NAD(P)H-dependent oxidoreductase [Mycobacterium persicum]|uniref:Chromate reductase n=1 Tax=Mycobacterium persicum TaxID=1487726 RepID=A0A1X0LFD6_9MYCO|nr:NAD(P)H-dependent oxidoreductase [Mycobacterium persicum]KZS85422.1 FMN reductase [Mycobacterium persicum]ORB34011.1 FMN reductase [Mycobacterium persicum]ORB91526.1 FMN reductase [Mycobacterium persicum]ORB96894.1 FMN reductase [Mycobacterium persicum]ORC03569.1 FMN reductase [Mycobacterium persicum]
MSDFSDFSGLSGIRVLALVGSLRTGSVNRQIAELAAAVAPDGVSVTVFEGLAELPFYNEDIDTPDGVPGAVIALRQAAAQADAALVVTPEYNGTIPAVIKNAIDWLSRPFGDGALKAKPLAVIGGSVGRYGGVWAHDETRKSFAIAGARVIDAIKLSVPFQSLAGQAPADSSEMSANLRDIVGKLAAEVG